MIVFLEAYYHYAMYPAGNNNKDEDKSPKTFNDKNHQASSQKFCQLILNLYYVFIIL